MSLWGNQPQPPAHPLARSGLAATDFGHPSCGPLPTRISSQQDLSTDFFLIGMQKLNSEPSIHKAITPSYELNSGNARALAKLKSGNTNISPKRFLICRSVIHIALKFLAVGEIFSSSTLNIICAYLKGHLLSCAYGLYLNCQMTLC